ncbi:uncharacterized protein LOC134535117 isoform X2 [Bacillus rossius redtenbacheri]|uniref:uncharacterized protein LOC134535117 isoform X2 n=1 Tax=Bacillus rossius redtenbacheri TaxID=93214 RepID=UPI002FDEF62D
MYVPAENENITYIFRLMNEDVLFCCCNSFKRLSGFDPPPRCQKIRSVRALTRFLTDHGVAWPRAEDLGSLTPSKRSLCAGLEASPQPAAVGPGRVSVACLDGPGPPSPGTPPGFVTAPSGGPPAGGAEVQTGGACTAGGYLEDAPARPPRRSASPSVAATTCTDDGLPSPPRRRRGAGRKGGPCVSPYFRRAGAGGGAPGRGRWQPPRSPFGLVQEELYHDPFQLLVATMLLNKTRGEAAVPVIWRLLARWPTAESLLGASEQDLAAVIRPLGLHRRRAHNIRRGVPAGGLELPGRAVRHQQVRLRLVPDLLRGGVARRAAHGPHAAPVRRVAGGQASVRLMPAALCIVVDSVCVR